MNQFDEKLKSMDLPQGLKELLQLSLSDEVKMRIEKVPVEDAEKAIKEYMHEANNGSVEPFDAALQRKLVLQN